MHKNTKLQTNKTNKQTVNDISHVWIKKLKTKTE